MQKYVIYIVHKIWPVVIYYISMNLRYNLIYLTIIHLQSVHFI